MMMNHLIRAISIHLILLISLSAQEWQPGLVLDTPPSPWLNGMAATGSSVIITDPFSLYANPAQIGPVSQRQNLGIHFIPSRTPILEPGGPRFIASAALVGYTFPRGNSRKGYTIGFGYHTSDLDFGEEIFRDENGDVLARIIRSEYYNGFTLGFGFRNIVSVNVGFSYKWFVSEPGFLKSETGNLLRSRVEQGVFDYGLFVSLPIHELLRDEKKMETKNWLPFGNVSIGFAQTNIGGEIEYNSGLPTYPMPRTVRLGYGLRGGLAMRYRDTFLQVFQLSWTVEANDLLVKETGEGFDYQGFVGDIDLIDNIILANGSDQVVSRQGLMIDAVETLRLMVGWYEGGGDGGYRSNGFAIHTAGLFKLLRKKYTKTFYSFLVDNMDIQFISSNYSRHGFENNYQGVLISFAGLPSF